MLKNRLLATCAAALISGGALAADLPARVAPPVFTPVPVFTWTGFYAGTHTGYAFSDNQAIRTFGNNNGAGGLTNTQLNVLQARRAPLLRSEQDGFTNLGGGFGYDYQFTPGAGFVVGAAADWTWTDLKDRRLYLSPRQAANNFTPDPSIYRQSLDWLGTVRGRIGYAFDRFLVYGTGGFAYGDVRYDAQFLNTAGRLAYAGRYSELETGYVYGGGIEYALPTDSFLNAFNFLNIKSQAVSLKVEYLRYDLGSRSVLVNSGFIPGVTGSYTSRFSTEGSIVRGGLNYRFGAF